MHHVKSLIYVVSESTKAVREYTAELGRVPTGHRDVPSILKKITTEADVLSSALSKLSIFVNELSDEEERRTAPDPIRAKAYFDHVRKVNLMMKNGVCSVCHGIKS